jgi:hypothetical protein
MKIMGLSPRTVILITIFLLIAFLVSGILVSTLWSEYLLLSLQTFLISLTASLVALFGGILAAIFVVERYLEYQSKLREEQQKSYNIAWQAYIEGGLSVLSALITHVCLFIAYGKERYLVLQEATGDTTDVPETIADFIPWLINNLELTHSNTPFENNTNSSVTKPSRGMGKDKALRFLDEFLHEDCITSIYTHKDLIVLKNFLYMFNKKLRDEIFLLQPFLSTRMNLGTTLVELSRYMEDTYEDIELIIISNKKTSSPLNHKFTSKFCSIGLKSTKLITLIWSFVEHGFNESHPTF